MVGESSFSHRSQELSYLAGAPIYQDYILSLNSEEICSRPKFIAAGVSKFDVEQGELGDCWLLAAISCLTLTPQLLERVIPFDQSFERSAYAGVFRFRFWKFGEWIEVIVDDRLPTYQGRLLYLHSSDPTEFWVALLEKAYAKFYGSYYNLHGGVTAQALQDLTGGIIQSFGLLKQEPMAIYQVLNYSVPRSTLLAASILIDNKQQLRLRNGLITQHAYSITGLAKVHIKTGEVLLVRLRNPWGKGEWNGPWSDRSWEWDSLSNRDRDVLSVRIRNDGEFWMSFEDFVNNFTNLDLVHIGPDDWMSENMLHSKKPWRAVMARRRWRSGFNAGGSLSHKDTSSMNPQFRIHIPRQVSPKCHVVISLTQKYEPHIKHLHSSHKPQPNSLQPIGFAIYEVPIHFTRLTQNYMANNKPLDITSLSSTRENVTFFTLPAGEFVVMPFTKLPNCDASFILRILTDEQINIEEVNEDNLIYKDLLFTEKSSKYPQMSNGNTGMSMLTKLQHRYPMELDALTLQKIIRIHSKNGLTLCEKPSLELCKYLVMLKDPTITGKISLVEIPGILQMLQFWRSVFIKFDKCKSGNTTSYNMRTMLYDAGLTVSNKVMECLIIRYGKDTVLSLENFILALVKIYLSHERYRYIEKKSRDTSLSLEEIMLMTIYS
ncbi:Calpain [Nymphon striatum]|nr:Calpain [Nymphon striatum]